MAQTKDRLKKQPTNAQRQEQDGKKALRKELQNAYFKGVTHGSHIQCSTILDVHKAKLDSTPKSKQTKEFLIATLNEVFEFCERGITSDLDIKSLTGTKDNDKIN